MSTASARCDWDEAERAIRGLAREASVLLVCHVNPDGDALGSMLGFGLGLRTLGYLGVKASFSGFSSLLDLPDSLRQMPGLDLLVPEEEVWASPEAVIALDAASLSRLGALDVPFGAAGRTVVIDHHASNTRFGQINLVDPVAAATSMLVERFLTVLGVSCDQAIAECLYIALATDTGSFRFNVTPAVHELAARLIATGIPAGAIAQRVFDTRPFGAVRLSGDVLARTELDPDAAKGLGLVWAYTTLHDLEKHGQRTQELESLIDLVRCVEEAEIACLIKQVSPVEWSVSLRSKGAIDVSVVAVALGGGGHRAAAGFTASGGVNSIIDSVRACLG